MSTSNNIKINLKSQKGFTLQDLVIACLIFTAFVGIIGTLMYSVYQNSIRADLSSQMTVYAVKILEDIDKISYEDAQLMTGDQYKAKFSIPAGFDVDLQLTDYGQGVTYIEDVMKIVNLKISYTLAGETEEITITRLKIKEM